MVGRVAHRKTGARTSDSLQPAKENLSFRAQVCIDIFAYAPVKKSRAWQKDRTHAADVVRLAANNPKPALSCKLRLLDPDPQSIRENLEQEQRYSDIEWWERVNDHADFTFL